jgi:hypothetical protein
MVYTFIQTVNNVQTNLSYNNTRQLSQTFIDTSLKARFEVLTVSMNMVVFWDVGPCSPVDINDVS